MQIEAIATKKDPSFGLLRRIGKKQDNEGACSLNVFFDLPGQMELYLQS